MFRLSLFTLFYFLVQYTGNFDAWIFPKFDATLTPPDSLVFIGESLRLKCQLDITADVLPENIYFTVTLHGVNKSWVIPAENITVHNRTVYADIEITEEYSKKNTVLCMAGQKMMNSVYVNVERPIQKVTNFRGIYYYNGHLDLSWSLAVTYLDVSSIKVVVDWNPNSSPNLQGNSCSNQTAQSCTIQKVYGQDIIIFRVVVNHKLMNKRPPIEYLNPLFEVNSTTEYTFSVEKHRKTAPPVNLKVIRTNSTCVIFTWDHPLYFSACNCHVLYQLSITRKDNTSLTVTDNAVRNNSQKSVSYCPLSPFTTNILSVLIKGDEDNPWSDPASIEFKTDEAQPLIGPPVTDTSYYAMECVTEMRDVILYWKDPLTNTLQGELTQFVITEDEKTIQLRKGMNYHKATLNCSVAHSILIYSATKVGRSIKPSEIIVPKQSDELPMAKDLTVMMRTMNTSFTEEEVLSLTVKWDPGLLRGKNVTFIFYMCQDTNVPYTCFNDFTTKAISVDKKEMVLDDLPSTTNLFGYSLRDGHGRKRGIQWINCVYRKDLKPDRPISVNVVNLTESLTISWTASKCDRLSKVLITQFNLFICSERIGNPRPGDGNCSDLTVNSTESTYTVKNLQGGHSYYVYIQAQSPAGAGPISQPSVGIPEVSYSPLIYIGISVGLVVVILLAIAVFCCFSCCSRSKKKITALVTGSHTILKDDARTQPQINKDLDTDRINGLTTSFPKKTNAPPPSYKSQIDGFHNELTRDWKANTSTAETSVNLLLNVTTEQKLTLTAEVLNDSESRNLLDRDYVHSNSDGVIPYVQITNTAISSAPEAGSQVSVDEGYNSPGAEVCSSMFLPQNVFMETESSQDAAKKTKLSPISSHVFSYRMLSPMLPKNEPIETKLPPISLQNVCFDSELFHTSSSLPTGLSLHVFNVNATCNNTQSILPCNNPPDSSFPDTDHVSEYVTHFGTNENGPTQERKSDNELFQAYTTASEKSTEILENENDVCKNWNKRRKKSVDYVTCTVDGEMNLRTAETTLFSDLKDLQNVLSDHTYNYESSQTRSMKMEHEVSPTETHNTDSVTDTYKSLEFIESSPSGWVCLQCGPDAAVQFYPCYHDDSANVRAPQLQKADYTRQDFTSGDTNQIPEKGDYVRHAFTSGDTNRLPEKGDYVRQDFTNSDTNQLPEKGDYVRQDFTNSDTNQPHGKGDYVRQDFTNGYTNQLPEKGDYVRQDFTNSDTNQPHGKGDYVRQDFTNSDTNQPHGKGDYVRQDFTNSDTNQPHGKGDYVRQDFTNGHTKLPNNNLWLANAEMGRLNQMTRVPVQATVSNCSLGNDCSVCTLTNNEIYSFHEDGL